MASHTEDEKEAAVALRLLRETPPDEMTDILKMAIRSMDGLDVVLLTRKKLTESDIKPKNSKLYMPMSQITSKFKADFLTEEEKAQLKGEAETGQNYIDCVLIDMEYVMHDITLRHPSEDVLTLNSPWMKIVKSHELAAGHEINIWAFRVDESFYLALEKVPL